MPKVALDGAKIASAVAIDHVSYQIYTDQHHREWVDQHTYVCDEWIDYETKICKRGHWEGGYVWVGGYIDHKTNATITGTVQGSSSNVRINGKSPIRVDDSVDEDETYSVPSNAENIKSDGGGTGRVTQGNNKNVYVNGKLVATQNSTTRTHVSSVSSSISSGVSSNVYIGG